MLHESPEDLTAYHDDDHVVQDQDQEYDVTQNLQDQDMSFFEQDKFSGLEDVGVSCCCHSVRLRVLTCLFCIAAV